MPGPLACCVVMLLVTWVAVGRAAVTAGDAVSVRIHDAADLEPAALETALRVAETALRAAAVEVSWHRCRSGGGCAAPIRGHELLVRFVRVPVPREYRGALPLGDALVDPAARAGVLATIYVNRVEWLSSVSDGDVATLLGHAVAHELGHLLLASTSHSRGGLMRATWSREEIRRPRAADWTFTAADAAAIRARLRGVAR